jgi:hypothetical protein
MIDKPSKTILVAYQLATSLSALSIYQYSACQPQRANTHKKRPLLRHQRLTKGLVDRSSVLVPGHVTVLTESRSAISPADNYSPLRAKKYA